MRLPITLEWTKNRFETQVTKTKGKIRMAKVLFTVSYQVRPEMRETYLSHVRRLRDHLQQEEGRNYTVFRSKGKEHLFSEVLVANSMEEFDTLEDNQDELTQNLLRDIEGCMEKGTTRYTTMVELD